MMMKFYIGTGTQADGRLTIHKNGCPLLPEPGERIFLGNFQSPRDATEEGRKYFNSLKSCPFCSKELHETGKIPENQEFGFTESYNHLIPSWEAAFICGTN